MNGIHAFFSLPAHFSSNSYARVDMNSSAREEIIAQQVSNVQSKFFDGINIMIDLEDNDVEIGEGTSRERDLLTQFVRETKLALKTAMPGSQISVGIVTSIPDMKYERLYDAVALANEVDFIFVVYSFDQLENIILDGECTARPNSGFEIMTSGIFLVQSYTDII